MAAKKMVLRRKNSPTQEGKEDKKSGSQERKRFYKAIQLAGELGLAVALPIIGGAILGRNLDIKFHSTPKVTLLMIFFGLLISIYNIYSLIKEVIRN